MVTVAHPQLYSSSKDGNLRIMPEAAHEVSATLLLTIDGRKVPIGNLRENFDDPANVMVRLGTKVSDRYPSSIGFRVLLRTGVPKSRESGSIDDNYHLVSCKFDPRGGEVSYAHATKRDKRELVEAQPWRKSLEEHLTIGTDQDFYRMDFTTSDTNGFLVSRHKPALRTSNGQIKKVEGLLPFVAYATKLSVFFIADKLLLTHLESAIKQNCVGTAPPSWKTALPDSAIPRWPSTCRHKWLQAQLTSKMSYLALFTKSLSKNYPNVRQEAGDKVYPVMLNVSDSGICVDLSFGASMLNRGNTYAAVNALHGLLAAGIALDHVGIITLYPAQVDAYQDALERCHECAPDSGYSTVQVGLIDDWVDKTVGVAIVDLVRTPNASGNLEYLSQATRLKVLLTLHLNGLIIVGDRGCTVTSHGSMTSAKLDRVLQWFVDNGRTVRISDQASPQLSESQSSKQVPSTELRHPQIGQTLAKSPLVSITNSSLSLTSSNASNGHVSSVSSARTLRTARKYVGIPGLEHLKIDGPVSAKAKVPPGEKNKAQDPTRKSFVRQRFINTQDASSRPEANRLASNGDAEFVHASYPREIVPKEAGLKPNAGAAPGADIAFKNEKKSQKPEDLTTEASAHGVHGPKSSGIKEVAIKGTDPFGLSSATSKVQDLLTSSTAIPNADINARFEAVTNRFKMEFGSDVYQKILNERRSKLSSLADLDISRTVPAPLPDLENAISGVESSSVNAPKGKDKPIGITKETPPQQLWVQPEALFPTQNPRANLPPHRATVKLLFIHTSQAASEEKWNIEDASTGQSLKPWSPEKASKGVADRNEATISRQNGNSPSAAKSKTDQEAEQRPNSITIYQKKYRAIRCLFTNMADMPRDQSGEDQLFHRLAEALIDEDFEAFERVYTEILSIATRLQTYDLHCA